ncbi:hypothetical protein BDR07DRAFT_158476 [Suillus spraguei]|nr:hypothetical protein BDR07DRAFT_158476 [Suillus spraguei]
MHIAPSSDSEIRYSIHQLNFWPKRGRQYYLQFSRARYFDVFGSSALVVKQWLMSVLDCWQVAQQLQHSSGGSNSLDQSIPLFDSFPRRRRVMFNIIHSNLEPLLPSSFIHTREGSSCQQHSFGPVHVESRWFYIFLHRDRHISHSLFTCTLSVACLLTHTEDPWRPRCWAAVRRVEANAKVPSSRRCYLYLECCIRVGQDNISFSRAHFQVDMASCMHCMIVFQRSAHHPSVVRSNLKA